MRLQTQHKWPVPIAMTAVLLSGCDETIPTGQPVADEVSAVRRVSAQVSASEREAGPVNEALSKAPQCAFSEIEHDFGTMSPDERGEHTFTFRNVGEAPLVVEMVTTSCKCVLSELAKEPIPPGGTGELTAEWVTRDIHDGYSQTITLKTNDPNHKRVVLRVVGKVTPEFAFRPSPVTLPTVHQHKPTQATVSLLSGQWKAFLVEEITPELDSIECDLSPLSAERIKSAGATSGYELAFTLPTGMSQGTFRHDVTMTVTPTDPPGDPRHFTLPIVGNVMGRLRLSGKGVDSDGVIRTSAQMGGEPRRLKLLLKVRDPEHPLLKLGGTEISHPCLTARLEPAAEKLAKKGLHYLNLEIDGRRLTESLMGDNRIDLKLRFDHPTVTGLDLKVEVVLDKAQGG